MEWKQRVQNLKAWQIEAKVTSDLSLWLGELLEELMGDETHPELRKTSLNRDGKGCFYYKGRRDASAKYTYSIEVGFTIDPKTSRHEPVWTCYGWTRARYPNGSLGRGEGIEGTISEVAGFICEFQMGVED